MNRRSEPTDDRLRVALAGHGVPLFVPAPEPGDAPDAEATVRLVLDLARTDDPRLVASIPSLLVARPRSRAGAMARATRLPRPARERLGLLHYVARCLAASRAPDLTQVLGRAPRLASCDLEPEGLPPVSDRHGRTGLLAASGRHRALVGDAERLFDQWLRMLRLERRTREPARAR